MKFSMCILICMGSICIVFGGCGTSTFFYFLQILQYFCYLFSLLLRLVAIRKQLLYRRIYMSMTHRIGCVHTGKIGRKSCLFLKKIGFFSKWHFSQKNRIFLEMTVKTSQENKEFWRKTKFLHIFPSAASNQNFSTHLVGPPPYQVGPPYSCVWPSKVSREVAMATCQ